MQPLALDPAGYGGTYKLIAGHVSLDLVNTISWPGSHEAHDWLHNPGNALLWCRAVALVDAKQSAAIAAQSKHRLQAQLDEMRAIRSTLTDALKPLGFQKSPDRAAVEALNNLLADTCVARRIDQKTLGWVWTEPRTLTEALAPVVWDGAHVLAEVDHSRIRHCSACDWLFYDSTRNRSRQWCDMQDCGSRTKALRYYHSQAAAKASRRRTKR
jgi:predicted RNA-binding Zn ribbon-like protein